LSGIAFALFYSVMGIPIARWADRGNRVMIIAITTAVWSVAVAACGAAVNFVQLLLIRIGVAIGEAGCVPPAHSLIADNYSRAERPRAVSRYMLGGPLSVVAAYLMAGWLNEFFGWRVTFALLGVPGLVLAALAWMTLKEPRLGEARQMTDGASSSVTSSGAVAQPGFLEVGRVLWSQKTFRHLLFYFAVAYFFGYGMGKWQPTFFMRSFGWSSAQIGTWFSVLFGLGGLVATWVGGELAVRYAAHKEPLQLRVTAIAYCVLALSAVGIYLSTNVYLALAFLGLVNCGFYLTVGPLFATIQTLVPERMRAVAVALILLLANLIGMGLGPLAAGALSDVFRLWAGEESLRYALLALSPGYLWGAWHLWRGSKTVEGDLELARKDADRRAREFRDVRTAGSKPHEANAGVAPTRY
jgi:MFS family permease